MIETRYTATLNIGRNGLPDQFANWYATGFASYIAARASAWFDAIENTHVNACFVDETESGYVTEPTVVVQFDLYDFDKAQFEAGLKRLCVDLNQGAIAYEAHRVNGSDHYENGLVGPRAAEWGGAFDSRYFETGETFHNGAWSYAPVIA